jgi:predicted HTH domain antitoxin
MTLQTINIDLPSDILLTLNESEEELKKRIKISLAVQLYIEKKVTIGKAAQIAELSRLQLETLEIEDVLEDIEKLK